MCGVMGYVRTGRNTVMTWPVVQATFKGIETRGRDASGFGVVGRKAIVCKRAIPSNELAKRKKFRQSFKAGDMLIGHARAATHGSPKNGRNNHPFWTEDGRYILVHNGVIMDNPEKLRIESKCDSEIALRMIEKYGVREAAERMFDWSMSSFAILVFDTKERSLYAFRNERSPLSFGNMKNEIGGYLIASTEEILRAGLKEAGIKKTSTKIIETHPYSLYRFEPGADDIEPIRLKQYEEWKTRPKTYFRGKAVSSYKGTGVHRGKVRTGRYGNTEYLERWMEQAGLPGAYGRDFWDD